MHTLSVVTPWRRAAVAAALLAALALSGCGSHKDAGQCDFYQGLGVNYVHMQGFVPSDIQDQIDKFC